MTEAPSIAAAPAAPVARWETWLVRLTSAPWVWIWTLAPLWISAYMLFQYRGLGRYGPPDFGGFEPFENHRAALQILEHGTTDMTFHATGYAYLVALVYLVLPKLPASVLVVQAALLPVMVRCISSIARHLGGDLAGRAALIIAGLYYPFAYYSATFTTVFPPFLALTAMVAVLLPLMQSPLPARWAWRAALAGVLLGVAVCCRPNMGLFGVVIPLAFWATTRSFKTAVRVTVPVGVISLAMLVGMTVANPPQPGQFVRGSQGMYRSLLTATYQFDGRWWDWDAWGDPYSDTPEWNHIRRLEAESGKPLDSPETQKLVYRDALVRLKTMPGNTAKKVLISLVRIWIFVPTHINSMPVKVAFAVSEAIALLLVLLGIREALKKSRIAWLGIGLMGVTMSAHLVMHVEARYSLPARGVYVAFLGLGVVALLRSVVSVRRSNA